MASLRIKYQTLELGEFDIHLRTLRDDQQFADPAGKAGALGISTANWSLFGVVWRSGRVLAEHMLDFDVADKRVLEVGCGIGLASLVLNARESDITATDYHPEVEGYLAQNVALNRGRTIPFFRSDWADTDSGMGRFDLIIGSDLLYERDHADLLSTFVASHAAPVCEVVIVDPRRGYHARFSALMQEQGFSFDKTVVHGEAEDGSRYHVVLISYRR